jgi:hypothetical protein
LRLRLTNPDVVQRFRADADVFLDRPQQPLRFLEAEAFLQVGPLPLSHARAALCYATPPATTLLECSTPSVSVSVF